ncbi:MAG: hypothetical protein LBU25_06655 [Treponema sp.]|nr:hypothetical protein [Treponema sp.]
MLAKPTARRYRAHHLAAIPGGKYKQAVHIAIYDGGRYTGERWLSIDGAAIAAY